MIIRVPDRTGNPEYDLLLTVDTTLVNRMVAVEVVTKAINDTHAADPDGYTFDDLLARLPEGITAANIVTPPVEW